MAKAWRVVKDKGLLSLIRLAQLIKRGPVKLNPIQSNRMQARSPRSLSADENAPLSRSLRLRLCLWDSWCTPCFAHAVQGCQWGRRMLGRDACTLQEEAWIQKCQQPFVQGDLMIGRHLESRRVVQRRGPLFDLIWSPYLEMRCSDWRPSFTDSTLERATTISGCEIRHGGLWLCHNGQWLINCRCKPCFTRHLISIFKLDSLLWHSNHCMH